MCEEAIFFKYIYEIFSKDTCLMSEVLGGDDDADDDDDDDEDGVTDVSNWISIHF